MQCRVKASIPALWDIDVRVGRHRIRHLNAAADTFEGVAEIIPVGRGQSAVRLPGGVMVVSSSNHAPDDNMPYLLSKEKLVAPDEDDVLVVEGLRWRRPPLLADLESAAEAVRSSWRGKFRFVAGVDDNGGLRNPQLGALHAIFAHWSVARTPATVVLPTGTGKTETMIAALVAAQIMPLLVVVPSIVLRDQISEKFQHLGVLKKFNVVEADTALPVVATVGGTLRSEAEVQQLFTYSNVVVTTLDSMSQSSEALCEALVPHVDKLFVDEAHHIPANTWTIFRNRFPDEKVVQFTATPFRGDKKTLTGRDIYNYPLRQAQEDGLFQDIVLRPITEYDQARADAAIAREALEQLERDESNGFRHLIMARVATVERAEHIAELYRSVTAHRVEAMHNKLSPGMKRGVRAALETRECRVVVCVDMLGEGYDLPALKIAALHDAHRGLGITLQFVGRFTRTARDVGPATAIANLADLGVSERLQELYSHDADWNKILSLLTEGAIGAYQEKLEFIEGFNEAHGEVALQNIKPKKSAEVYWMKKPLWRPRNLSEAIGKHRVYFATYNPSQNVAIAVVRRTESVGWGELEALRDVNFDLILAYYNADLRLLFIHSSDTRSYHARLAAELTENTAVPLRGEDVFRSLHGIKRLLVANLGLKNAVGKSIYFTMYAGVNVHENLTLQNLQNKTTSNLFGFGYEDGDRASAGCSYKGRIWAYKVSEDISDWVAWCKHVGAKLSDTSIDPGEFLQTKMRAKRATERPSAVVPLSIEWSDNVWLRNEEAVVFTFGKVTRSLLDVGLKVADLSEEGPIRFEIFTTDGLSASYELDFTENGVEYTLASGPDVQVKYGQRTSNISEWFQEEPPTVRFDDGQQLSGDLLISAPEVERPFDVDTVEVWDWSDTNIDEESQGIERKPRSIQRKVIKWLINQEKFDVVFDDDESNEAADVIAIRLTETSMTVRLFHCKYASKGRVRNSVVDLYELCGQAQRNVHWKADKRRLIDHMIKREKLRNQRGATRFEEGNYEVLHRILKQIKYLDVDMDVTLVHPGVSKTGLSAGQRDLLATTQLYLSETYGVSMYFIANK